MTELISEQDSMHEPHKKIKTKATIMSSDC